MESLDKGNREFITYFVYCDVYVSHIQNIVKMYAMAFYYIKSSYEVYGNLTARYEKASIVKRMSITGWKRSRELIGLFTFGQCYRAHKIYYIYTYITISMLNYKRIIHY